MCTLHSPYADEYLHRNRFNSGYTIIGIWGFTLAVTIFACYLSRQFIEHDNRTSIRVLTIEEVYRKIIMDEFENVTRKVETWCPARIPKPMLTELDESRFKYLTAILTV